MTTLTKKAPAKATIMGVIAAAFASVILTLSMSAQPAHASQHAAATLNAGNKSLSTASALHRGMTFTVDGNKYRITDYEPFDDDLGEVVLVKYGSAKKSVNINTVRYKGELFEVEAIGKNAFNNAAGHKVTSVTLGRNVDKVYAKAFYGCSKIKTLNLARTDIVDIDRSYRGYYIDEIDMGSQALKKAGIPTMKVKCGKGNASYQALYKKALMKKGLRSDAVVTR